ncbi:hypothetical protein M758_6G061800 [Ceratodon purpureus]|nr:hypothetical protein M758_6G061800 [Ceratodon purpureus]
MARSLLTSALLLPWIFQGLVARGCAALNFSKRSVITFGNKPRSHRVTRTPLAENYESIQRCTRT